MIMKPGRNLITGERNGKRDWFMGGGYDLDDLMPHTMAIMIRTRNSLICRLLELADLYLPDESSQRLRNWLSAKSDRAFCRDHQLVLDTFQHWFRRTITALVGLMADDAECQRLLSTGGTAFVDCSKNRKLRAGSWPSTEGDRSLRGWVRQDEERTRTQLHNERKVQAFRDGKCQSCFREPIKRDGKCQWCLKYEARMAKRRPQ